MHRDDRIVKSYGRKTENDETELASGWRLQKVPDKRRTIARGSVVNRTDKLKLSLLLHKELSQKIGFKNR
jgi:hypothetical protein